MGSSINWRGTADQLNLLHFEVDDWVILMEKKLLFDSFTHDPWLCLLVLFNPQTDLCISRCLQATVHRGFVRTQAAFDDHCKKVFDETEVKTFKNDGFSMKALSNKAVGFQVPLGRRVVEIKHETEAAEKMQEENIPNDLKATVKEGSNSSEDETSKKVKKNVCKQ